MVKKSIGVISILMVLILTVALTGCGGEKKPAAQTNANEIRIGTINELTGGNASYGNSILNGIKLAVAQINESGGVLGKKIILVDGDNKSEPSEAANVMTKLITQDKVSAVVGSFTSSCAISSSNVAQAQKVAYVSSAATNPKLTVENGKTKEYIFRACFIDPFQGGVAANFILNNLKLKTAVVLVDNSSDYSKGLLEFFQKSFEKGGGKILATESYLQKDQDFKTILTKIKALNPEVIYLPGYYEEVGKIVKQARELDIKAPFVGGDGWDSTKLVEIAGANALNNTYFTNHYSPENSSPESKAFVDAYRKTYGKTPDGTAVLGYDAMKMVALAIKDAQSAEPAKIKDALAKIKNFPGASGVITINANHDADKSAVIIEMKDGKQVYKQTINP